MLIFGAAAVFLVASSILYSFAAGDGGTPVTPNNFYGTLTINGNPAGIGTRMKGMVGGEDKTTPSPYTTQSSGQYGCLVGLDCKFGVNCTQGEDITFLIEKSPSSGNFFDTGTIISCNPGADTNMNIAIAFNETCTNGQTRACPLQQGVCTGSYETCTDSQWPGCTAQNYGQFYEAQEASCDNKDNDCDGVVDGMSQNCGSGQCAGTQTCSAGQWGDCSTSGNDCGVCAACDAIGGCAYDESQDSDCDYNDILGIAICTNDPDANPFTWDSRAAFDSQCSGMNVCSQGSGTITHACSKASCLAPCETDADCNDLDPNTIDMCLADCTCQNIYLPSCGNGQIDEGETCEYPSTSNNEYCPQAQTQCQGTKLGTRDAFGYCNILCGCTQDSFTYSCVAGECGAECSYDSDCDDLDPNTVDTCLNDCMCQYTEQTEYCLLITDMRVLNSVQDEDYTIPAGTMYYIEMSTYNSCDQDVQSMQIVQVLKGAMPVNLGSLTSTIHSAESSVMTVGFIMSNGTPQGTQFTANGFNWNHWIDQSPGTFEILSAISQVSFQSE